LGLYSQAIEYYSALGDPQHEQFLHRQMQFLKQPEINAVLSSQVEAQKQEDKQIKQTSQVS